MTYLPMSPATKLPKLPPPFGCDALFMLAVIKVRRARILARR